MSEALMLKLPLYEPPADLAEVADRPIDDKRLILYVGKSAIADIVSLDEKSEPGILLLRIESSSDKAMDLFHHPAPYVSDEHLARQIFDHAA